MLISFDDIVNDYNAEIRGVIHIGAHFGQEYDMYKKHNIKNLMFFEPLVANYRELLKNIPKNDNIKTFNIALGDAVGNKVMFVETANNGQSSSILEPGTHLDLYPNITFDNREVVKIDRLDNIPFDRTQYNMINIDVQGYELEVFKGARDTLSQIDIVYAEINTNEVYKGCPLLSDIDHYLGDMGFSRILTHMACDAWGDAYYKRTGNG